MICSRGNLWSLVFVALAGLMPMLCGCAAVTPVGGPLVDIGVPHGNSSCHLRQAAKPEECSSIQFDENPERLVMTPRPGNAEGAWARYVTCSLNDGLVLNPTELILSWNVSTPAEIGVWFEVRVRDADGWSPWLFIGEWGDIPAQGPLVTEYARGKVAIDVLENAAPFSESQIRITAARGPTAKDMAPVFVHHVALTVSEPSQLPPTAVDAGPTADSDASFDWFMTSLGLPGSVRHEAPFFSQATGNPDLAGRLCSPTSVTMALGGMGITATVEEIAATARDPRHDIYGNWPRNVQTAFTRGVSGEVRRFGSPLSPYWYLARGALLVASIRAEPGELRGAPYNSTDGHLILLHGYDEHGDFLVLDPAASNEARGSLTYSAADMARVWLWRGKGTAYVLWPPGMPRQEPTIPEFVIAPATQAAATEPSR